MYLFLLEPHYAPRINCPLSETKLVIPRSPNRILS
jgi:hypothetical protein